MKFLSIKHRITLGLVCLMISTMLLVMVTGLGPNSRRATMQGRGQLCESIAFNTSILLNQNELSRMEGILAALVERNDDILSAGLRKKSGDVVCELGEHFANWNQNSEYSTETHVSVPLRNGEIEWGDVEIRFDPIQQPTLVGWLTNQMTVYVLAVSIGCFLGFSFYLGRVLKQLDPSQAVPKRVRTALDSLAEGLIVTDGKGQIALANEAFAKWAGQDAEKLMGKNAAQFPWSSVAIDPKLHVDDDLPWERALRNKQPEAGFLIKLKDCNHRELTLVANSSPVLGAEGKYRGVLTSFEDVTDLERHKVELCVAKDEADRANREKSEFLARMSHEIRTPMNAIMGYTEVLQFGMEENEDQRQQHLSTIQESGEHLLALINDILDLSKIESGQMELEKTHVSLHDLITNVVSVLEMKAKQKNIRLDYQPAGHIPATIFTDAIRLKQTIINLVGNAIKFTQQGGVLIQPELVEMDGRTLLSIHVADTGIGMNAEAMAKIFDPFSQADTSITRRFGGTGLGLSICRELTKKLGGDIKVRSKPGEGSIFTATIDPGELTDVDLLLPDQLVVSLREKNDTVEQFHLPTAKVLIVDDGEANRELVALFLKRAGINFEMSENGQVAVEMAMAGNYDAILMDMHMPIMDGFEATRMLRSQGFTIPIIALTADAMAEDERKCRDAGCSGFLSKPIRRERLYEAISEAIDAGTAAKAGTDCDVGGRKSLRTIEDRIAAEISQLGSRPLVEIDAPMGASNQHVDRSVRQNDLIESCLPMDDVDFVMIANLFVDQLQLKLEAMDTAAEASDFQELFELGHWLKGAGGSAGFDDFSAPAKQLEVFAKANDLGSVLTQISEIRAMSNRIRVPSNV